MRESRVDWVVEGVAHVLVVSVVVPVIFVVGFVAVAVTFVVLVFVVACVVFGVVNLVESVGVKSRMSLGDFL